MKKLLLIPLLVLGTSLFAQSYCSKDHPIYNMDDKSTPRKVYHLGSNPEFPFLRNLSTPQQVLYAMQSKQNEKKYPRQMKELNKLLVEIGFSNGVGDVTVSNISALSMPSGTTGNMGDGHFNYEYSQLAGGTVKAWKVTQNDKCDVTFLSKCGNAFYPFGAENAGSYTGNKPCKEVEVAVNTDPREVTVDGKKQATKKTYVYYKTCSCVSCENGWSQSGYDDGMLSKPLLVKKEEVSSSQTYKVSSGASGHVTMCDGQPTEITTEIQVEREGEYTGYKPQVTKEYIEVSKSEYKRALKNKRLMAKLEDRPHLAECTSCN